MSYLSLLKSIPNGFRQPTGIALIASCGLHGLVGISLPLLSPPQAAEPDLQQRVQVMELSPEQEQRLPETVRPQRVASLPSFGNQNPYSRLLQPNGTPQFPLSGQTPGGYSLRGLPGMRIPGGYNPYAYQNNPYAMQAPLSQGAPLRQPGSFSQGNVGQQRTQVPITPPLFDQGILQAAVPQWNVTPGSENLQIYNQSTPSASPSPTTSPSPQGGSPGPSPHPTTRTTPETIPPAAIAELNRLREEQELLAYNPAGTGDASIGPLKTWQEEIQANEAVRAWQEANPEKVWQALSIKGVSPPKAKTIFEKDDRSVIKATIGVIVNGEGAIVGEPTLIMSTGYGLLDKAARDTVLNHEYDATGATIPYLITLEFSP